MSTKLGVVLSTMIVTTTVASCLGATQITLDIRTDLACSSPRTWHGVSVAVGAPGVDVESRAPVLTTTACGANGEVGTLVIVPTASKTADVGIKVVAGITRNPEDCSANDYDGCIVARRTITFLEHQGEQVVVELTNDCLGNACDAYHTCVNGACNDTASVTMPTAGTADANGGPTVRCGDDGTTCPVNDRTSACCVAFDVTSGTGTGTCVAPHDCPSTSAIFYCDDASDCPMGDGGTALVCCLSSAFPGAERTATGAACVLPSNCPNGGNTSGVSLCQDRQPCPNTGHVCGAEASAPGYFSCDGQP